MGWEFSTSASIFPDPEGLWRRKHCNLLPRCSSERLSNFVHPQLDLQILHGRVRRSYLRCWRSYPSMPSSCSSEANYRGTRPSESIHHTCPIPKNQPTDPLLLTLYPTWCHSHYRIRLLLPCLVSQQSFLRVFPYTMYRFGKRVSESSMAVYSNDHNCTRPPLTLKYLKRLTFLLVLCCVLGELHLCSFIDSLEKDSEMFYSHLHNGASGDPLQRILLYCPWCPWYLKYV